MKREKKVVSFFSIKSIQHKSNNNLNLGNVISNILLPRDTEEQSKIVFGCLEYRKKMEVKQPRFIKLTDLHTEWAELKGYISHSMLFKIRKKEKL